jgi:hypothetical protein
MSELIRFWLRVLIAVSSVLLLMFVWFVFGVVIGAFPWSALQAAVHGILCVGALPASAAGVLLLTHWLNRRDDPRRQKRPPDAP